MIETVGIILLFITVLSLCILLYQSDKEVAQLGERVEELEISCDLLKSQVNGINANIYKNGGN